MYFGGAVSGIVVWSNFNTVSSSGDILSGNFNVKGPSPIRYVGLLIWAGAWIGSIYDAGKSANEINKKNGYGHLIEFGDERVVLGVDPVDQRNRLGTALTHVVLDIFSVCYWRVIIALKIAGTHVYHQK